VFNKYTYRKLDRKKLEAALDAGEVPSVKVAPYVDTKMSAPFIRFTMKEDNEEADAGL